MIDFGRPYAPGYAVNVGSGWGQPRAGGSRKHEGLDVYGKPGTPIVSVADGAVFRVQHTDTGAAGLYVGVRHDKGIVTRYMHMSRIEPGMKVGLPVRKGQVLGYVGNTGASEGPHLHLDVRVPPELLSVVESMVGKPATGWGTHQEGAGTAIPGEPWIPVDSYRNDTIKNAARWGIPLYVKRGLTVASVALLALLVYGGFRLLAKRRR